MATKKNEKPKTIVLGGEKTLKLTAVVGQVRDDDGEITSVGEKFSIEIDYRQPKTSERIQYTSKTAGLAKKIETEAGFLSVMSLRQEYAKKVFLAQRGLEFPDGMGDAEGMAEYGTEYLTMLARYCFEGLGNTEVDLDDTGKSVKTSETSLTDVSAQSSEVAVNTS